MFTEADFQAAVRDGDVRKVQAFLGNGASQNFAKQSDAQGKMPLQVAAEGGNADLIRVLLTAGGATNQYELNSSLIAAAQNGRADAVNLLLERGADIWTTRDALTAEQHARKRGFTQIAATLGSASKARAKRVTSALWALGYLPRASEIWDAQADASATKFRGAFQSLSGSLEEALDAACGCLLAARRSR